MNCAVLMLFGRKKPVLNILYISSLKETETKMLIRNLWLLQTRETSYKKKIRNTNENEL